MASTVAEEITALKAQFDKQCRVIDNIGDFKHVITIKREGSDLAYKFQIDELYPSAKPHIVIKECRLRPEDQVRLIEHLNEIAQEKANSFIVSSLVEAADKWIVDQGFECLFEESETAKSPSKKKGTKKKTKGKVKEKEEKYAEKKSSMKTAEEVIKRIQWDSLLQSEHFSVGYLDRFIGVVEKTFAAFSWEDLASVDYDDLAIPQHRIQYFKYKDEVVWDKNKRLDNIFGSTGSGKTIIDVISAYREQPKEPERADSDDDSDSDDDINVCAGITVQPNIVSETTAEEREEFSGVRGRDLYWGAKARPTHFLCLRVTDPAIREGASRVHDIIRKLEPSYEPTFIPPQRLHITLGCLGLDTVHDLNRASRLLHDLQSQLQDLNPQGIEVRLNGIDNFHHNVLYAKVEENAAFMSFVDHLRTLFSAAGMEFRDVFDYHPHMTLLKFKKQMLKEMKTRFTLDARIYEAVAGIEFGLQSLSNVHLCEMSENQGEDAFYICSAKIEFQKREHEDAPAEW